MPSAAAPQRIDDPRHAPRAAAGLRLCLRSVTADAHARLDARMGSLDLTMLPDYRLFLEVSAGALFPLEEALINAGVIDLFPDWPARSRTAALWDDLERVGGVIQPLKAHKPLDFGGVLGTIYVLEGSRLGARLLLSAVERSPDPLVAQATAYLRHGTGQNLWPTFLAALESHACVSVPEASVIDGALNAFGLFEQAAAAIGRPEPKSAPHPSHA